MYSRMRGGDGRGGRGFVMSFVRIHECHCLASSSRRQTRYTLLRWSDGSKSARVDVHAARDCHGEPSDSILSNIILLTRSSPPSRGCE